MERPEFETCGLRDLMAIYLVSGRLGSGKTLAAVGRIKDALMAGRRVATNLDINLDKMFSPQRKYSLTRLPDKPVVDDLELIGCGNDEMDELKNGLIVLDELGSFLNSRQFQDKGRAAVIDWLIHSRKLGWDVIFIVQHIDMVDKQIRTALVEYLVTCRRLDRLRIPFFGSILKAIGLPFNMPKIHIGVVRYGTDQNSIIADKWVYMARNLYDAYDTRQIFKDNYEHGTHSVLSAWHVRGRYLDDQSLKTRLLRFAGFLDTPRRPVLKTKLPAITHIAANSRITKDQQWHAAKLLCDRHTTAGRIQ